MAAEEDKKFDAVLGGFLVNDLRVRAGHLHCPESDVLAAYHDRSLLPEEMNSWKEHIVGCVRCQAILSELAATDSIPLQVSEREAASLEEAAKPATVASEDRSAPPVKVPQKSRVVKISPGARWKWLAPAGALAAGLLVWVAWHESQPPQVKAPVEVKMAKAEPPSAQEPPTTQQAAASPSSDQLRTDQLARLSKDEDAIRGEASTGKLTRPENLHQLEKSDSRARATLVNPSADKEAGARQDAGRDSALAANRIKNQPAQDAKAGAGAMAETVEVQPQIATAQVQNQQNPSNAQKLPGPSPLDQAQQAQQAQKKAKSESPALAYRAAAAAKPAVPAPAPTPAAAFSDMSASPGLLVGDSKLNLIAVPNKRVLWRAGRAGMIEFSRDGGTSWTRQTSNVLVDLTSGSAPSDKVCWIVGRAGTILLTIDAGSHWAILHSPLDEDLGGVRATDALHAIVWNSGNTKIFETMDGGTTWKPAPAQ